MFRVTVLVATLAVGGCGKKSGGADARRAEATRLEEFDRHEGHVTPYTTRGADASTLVVHFNSEISCKQEEWEFIVGEVKADKGSAAGLSLDRLTSLGFKRLECEDANGNVAAVDLPFTPKPKPPADSWKN